LATPVLSYPATLLFVVFFAACALLQVRAAHAQADAAAPAGAAQRAVFDILEFVVEGNSVLPQIEVERAVYRHLGPGRGFDDVERARGALEKAYQDAGFLTVLVEIPEQQVRGGLIRLQVTEGQVGRVRVTGSRYYSLGEIKARSGELAEGTVPYFPEVQKQLATLNRTEDRKVTPVLKPGATPGKVDVELKVEDRLPLHGDLELNNRASANTEALRLSGSLRYDNLWDRDHSLSVSYQMSPQNTSQVKVASGTYVIPRAGWDNTLALYGVRSRSNVAAVGTLSVLGNTDILGARYIVPLPAGEGRFHSLTLGLDYKQFRDTVNLSSGVTTQTPLSYAPGSLAYSLTDRDSGGTTQAGAGANVGLRNFGGTKEGEFANKRFLASASYLALKGDLSRLQAIGGPFSLFAKVDAQIASGPLVSNEQFVAGGADTVRGYREAEILGDRGFHGVAEARYALAGEALSAANAEGYLSAFVEGAVARIYNPLPAQQQRFGASSAGVGLRLKGQRSWRVWFDVAQAFKPTAFTPRGTVRGSFRFGYEF
jgi:hemolysin activation/secretion protein